MILLDSWQETDRNGRPHTIRKYWWVSQSAQAMTLKSIIERYRQMQSMRALAVHIVFDQYRCPPKLTASHAIAIGDWVQKRILYVNEIPETFSTPVRTLVNGYEDCDGHAVLVNTLCESIGIPTQLVLVWWASGYRHIFPRALVKMGGRERVLSIDTTLNQPVGALVNPLLLAAKKHGTNFRYLVL